MNKFKIVTYKGNDFLINLRVSLEEETIWMTQKEIASVFNVTTDNISLHIRNIFKGIQFNHSVSEDYSVTAQDGKKYNTKIYDLENIYLFIYKVISKIISKYISSINKIINQIKGVNLYYE